MVKNLLSDTLIKEARGLISLTSSEVKFESLKKVNNRYKISGVYECKELFSSKIIESGRFKIVLNEKLEIISVDITPERYK